MLKGQVEDGGACGTGTEASAAVACIVAKHDMLHIRVTFAVAPRMG